MGGPHNDIYECNLTSITFQGLASWGSWRECPGQEFTTSLKLRYKLTKIADSDYRVLPGLQHLLLTCENGNILNSWNDIALERTVGYVFDSNVAVCSNEFNYMFSVKMKYHIDSSHGVSSPTAVNSFAMACTEDYFIPSLYYSLVPKETEMRYLPEIPKGKKNIQILVKFLGAHCMPSTYPSESVHDLAYPFYDVLSLGLVS